jgi:hypothetical protein
VITREVDERMQSFIMQCGVEAAQTISFVESNTTTREDDAGAGHLDKPYRKSGE